MPIRTWPSFLRYALSSAAFLPSPQGTKGYRLGRLLTRSKSRQAESIQGQYRPRTRNNRSAVGPTESASFLRADEKLNPRFALAANCPYKITRLFQNSMR